MKTIENVMVSGQVVMQRKSLENSLAACADVVKTSSIHFLFDFLHLLVTRWLSQSGCSFTFKIIANVWCDRYFTTLIDLLSFTCKIPLFSHKKQPEFLSNRKFEFTSIEMTTMTMAVAAAAALVTTSGDGSGNDGTHRQITL